MKLVQLQKIINDSAVPNLESIFPPEIPYESAPWPHPFRLLAWLLAFVSILSVAAFAFGYCCRRRATRYSAKAESPTSSSKIVVDAQAAFASVIAGALPADDQPAQASS